MVFDYIQLVHTDSRLAGPLSGPTKQLKVHENGTINTGHRCMRRRIPGSLHPGKWDGVFAEMTRIGADYWGWCVDGAC
eukprot:6212697-Prymnesium_polylepis.2